MVAGRFLATAALLVLGGGPAAAETVIEGRAAQALRCAAYVGMAGQYRYAEGSIPAEGRDLAAYWSMMVLYRWVPLDMGATLAAYRSVLGEIGSQPDARALIARHADWCVQEFTPTLS
jgi:hypothetical protein